MGRRGLDPSLIVGIVGNIGSVVGVVLCNKYVINQGFRFTMVLSALHFLATWIGCTVMLKLRYFQYKPARLKDLLPVALVSCALSFSVCARRAPPNAARRDPWARVQRLMHS
jgi:hypothetical protein